MTDAMVKDLDQGLFSELSWSEPLVQPIIVHMVRPFANENDPKFCFHNQGKKKTSSFLKIKMKEPEGDLRRTSYVLISKENQASAFKEGRIFLQFNRISTEQSIILWFVRNSTERDPRISYL